MPQGSFQRELAALRDPAGLGVLFVSDKLDAHGADVGKGVVGQSSHGLAHKAIAGAGRSAPDRHAATTRIRNE